MKNYKVKNTNKNGKKILTKMFEFIRNHTIRKRLTTEWLSTKENPSLNISL